MAGAALRVADVTRVLKNNKLQGEKGGDVAKLFAKHFKLAQHVTYLKRTKVGAAAGTPGRLGKLLNETGMTTALHYFTEQNLICAAFRCIECLRFVPYHP